ncbi:hypothetical protein DIPPA_10837 [Diplonema papillatum]|nr:hypothetical protein DIPPA_10837 [Diplonema papillatum]
MSPGTRLSSCLSPGQTPLPASPPRPFLLSVRPPPDLARCADPEAASSAPMSPSRSPSVESPPAGCEWALRDSSRRAPLAFGALASDPDPGLRRQEQGEATSSRLNAASNGEELLHEPARREDIPSESNAAPQGYPQGLLHEPAAHRKQGEATSSRLNAASKGEESLNTIPSESNAAQRRPLHAPAVNRKREDGANELSSASEGRELLHEPAESRRQREAAPKELNAAPQGHGSELNAASRRGRESHRQECSWSSHEPNASEQRDGASSNELYTLSGEPDDDSARAHGSADNPEKDGKQGEASWLDVELSSDHEHGTRDQGPPREAAAPSEAGQGRRRAVVSESTLRGAGNSGSREQRAAAAPSSSRIDRRQPQEEEPAAQSGSSGSRESRATAAPSNSRSDQRRWQDEEPVAQVRGQRRASNGSSGSHEPGATAAPNNSRIDRRRWQDEEPVAQVRGQRRASNGSSGSHEPRATAAPNNSRIDRRRWQDEEPVAQVRGQRRASNGSIGSHEPRATAAPSNSRTDRRRWQKEEPAAQPRGKRKLSSDSSHQPASNWSHPCNGGEPAEPREFGAEGPAASLASRRPANPPRLARRGSSWSVPEIVPRGHTSAPLLRLHRTKTADSHRKLVTLADCPAGRSVSVGASSLAFRRKPPPPCADRGRALLLPAAQRRVQKAKDGQAGGPRGVAGTRFAPFQARADAPARLRSCSQPPSSASSAVPGQHPSRSVSQPPSSASSAVPGQHPPSSASCAVPGQHPSRSVSQPSAPQRPPAAASSCEGCPAEARTQPAHAAFRPTRSVSQPPAPQPQSVAASSCEGCPAEARTQPPRALALRLTRSLSQPQKASGQPVLRPIPSSARCRPDADDGRSAEWTAKGALGSHLCPRPDSERPPSFLPSRDGESVLGSPSPGCALRRRSYSQGSCDLSQSGRLVLPPSRAACSRSASGASSSIFEHSLPEHAQTGGQFYRLASLSGAVSVSPPCPPPRTDASVPEGLSRPDEAEVEQNPSPSSSPVAGRLASVSGPSEASLFPPPCAETRPDAVEVEQGSSPSSCHPDRLASVSGVSSLCPPPCAETSVSTSFEVLGRLSRPDAVGVEQDSSPSSCHLDRLASVPGPSLCPPPCTETSATHSFGVCGRFSRPGTVEAEQDSSSSSCPSGALPSAGQLCRPVGLPASQVPPAPGTIDRGNRPCEAAGEHVPFPFCETAPAAACSPPSLACLRMPLVAFQAAALNAPAGSGHPCRKRGKPSAADVSSALPSAEPARPPLKFSAAVWRASVPEDQRPGENAAGVAELPRPVRELSATRVVKTAHIELEEAAEAHTLPCGVLDAPAPEQPGTSEAHTSPSGEPDAPAPEQSGKQPRGFSATSQRARVVKTAHIEKEEISEAHTLPCGVLDAPTPEQSGKQPKRFSATSRVVKTAHIEKEETSEARTLPPGELEAPAPGRPGRLLKFSATRCPPRAAEPVRGGKENPSERLDAAPPSELPEKPCGQLRFPAPGHDAGQAAELPPSERCAGEAVGAPCEAAPAGADAGHRVSHDVTRLASRAAPRPRPVLSGGKKGDDPNAEPATFASTVCDVDAALEAEREGSLGVNCAKATAPSPTMSMAQPSQRLDPPVGAVGWFQLDAAAAAFSPAPAPPRLADRQARRVGPPSPRLHAVVENIAQFLSAVSAAPPDPTRCCAAPGGEPAPGPASVGEGSACSISPSASVLSERTSSCAREGVVSAASLAGEATPPLSRVHPAAEHAAASSGVSFEPASCVSEGPSPGVAPAAPAARTAGSAASGGAPPSPRQRAAASRALSSSAASAGVVEGNAGAEAPSPTPSETSRSESPDIAWLPESTTTSYRAAPGTRAAEGPGTYASTNTEAASPTPPPEASSSESPVIAWLPECTTTSYRAAPSTSVVEGPGTYANTSAEAPSSTPLPKPVLNRRSFPSVPQPRTVRHQAHESSKRLKPTRAPAPKPRPQPLPKPVSRAAKRRPPRGFQSAPPPRTVRCRAREASTGLKPTRSRATKPRPQPLPKPAARAAERQPPRDFQIPPSPCPPAR